MPAPSLPREVAAILKASLRVSDAEALLRRKITRRGKFLKAGRFQYDLSRVRRLYVVGAGKASAAMAQALVRVLGDRVTAGLVIVPYGYSEKVAKIKIVQAAHPCPDSAGLAGTRRILSLLSGVGKEDLVIVLLSGGGSALMPYPVQGVTLSQKQKITQLLLESGADIHEINTVRKHLSQLKGGQLARCAAPARVLTLILSDVPGNSLDTIASGPTYPDATTYSGAVEILHRYDLWRKMPLAMQKHLLRGQRGTVADTPKPGDPAFLHTRHIIIGDNRLALRSAAAAATALGLRTQVLTGYLKGEAREVAQVFSSLARERHRGGKRSAPVCLLAGGETTVTVRGKGRGGRCQEFALAAAPGISGLGRTIIAAFGTDGADGAAGVAGAYVDETTLGRAKARGMNPLKILEENDSYTFFKALGQHIRTGPTRTNVNDLYLLITR